MTGLAIKEVSLNGRNHYFERICHFASEFKEYFFSSGLCLNKLCHLRAVILLSTKKFCLLTKIIPFIAVYVSAFFIATFHASFVILKIIDHPAYYFSSYIHFRSFQLVHIFQVIEVIMFFDTVWYFLQFLFFIQSQMPISEETLNSAWIMSGFIHTG